MMTSIHERSFIWDQDIELITQLLLDSYLLHGCLFNWDPRRWQGLIFHNDNQNLERKRTELTHQVHLWMDSCENILGAVIPESPKSVFLQILPDHRPLEAEMLDWIHANLRSNQDPDGPAPGIWALDGDDHREQLLSQRGYVKTDIHETMYRRSMSDPVPAFPLPPGYSLRNMRRLPEDRQALADLLNSAFNRTFHSAEEYRNYQESPHYRSELDIVVEEPGGTLAANAGLTVHVRESFGLFEPVCTHPDHQGLGLAKAAITEGLRRAKTMGTEACFIGAWYSNPVSNHVYQSLGFSDGQHTYLWRKQS